MTFWLLEQRRREDVSQASSVCEVYYTMEARWGVASWLDKWPFQSVNLCYPHKLFQGKAGARKTTCHLIHKALAGWCWHLTWTNHLWCMRKIWMRCEKDVPRKTLCHFFLYDPPTCYAHTQIYIILPAFVYLTFWCECTTFLYQLLLSYDLLAEEFVLQMTKVIPINCCMYFYCLW